MKKNNLLIISMFGACFQASALFNKDALKCFLNNANSNSNISSVLSACNQEMDDIMNMTFAGGSNSNYGDLALKLFKDNQCRAQILSLFKQYGSSCDNILQGLKF